MTEDIDILNNYEPYEVYHNGMFVKIYPKQLQLNSISNENTEIFSSLLIKNAFENFRKTYESKRENVNIQF